MRFERALGGFTASILLSLIASCGSSGGGGGAPTPALTGPIAGSVLAGTQSITWVSPADANTVEIRLSTDGGASYPTILTGAAPDTGSFAWDTTSGADGAQNRIRITPTDTSNIVLAAFGHAADFTVDNTIPVITLISPQAGGVFGGTNASITWQTVDANPGTVGIELSGDGGTSFPTQLSSNAPDTGSFTFDATSQSEGNTYRIRVTPTDLAGNLGVADESSGNAEIDNTPPTISLNAPLGGEVWASFQDVTYTMADANPLGVVVLLSADSGVSYPETIAPLASVSGPFEWNTGLSPDGSTYRIRVIGVDRAGNRSLVADSPGDFTLENIVLERNATYLDVNLNGALDAGDRLILSFNEEIVLGAPSESDFQMYVAGDSVGTGVTIVDLNEVGDLAIVLNTGMGFKARGVFDADQVGAGESSGMDVADVVSPNSIENQGGTDVAPVGGVDIEAGFVLSRTEAGSDESTSVSAGDMDGDGRTDFAIGRSAGFGIALRLENGVGQYPLAGGSPLGTDTVNDVLLADLDGDGDLDIASACAGPNRVWLGDGAGAFTDSAQLLGASISQAVVAGDLDRDGDLDLVFGNDIGGPARVYLNNGAGVFTGTGQGFQTTNTVDLDIGDLDGDGDLDLLAGNQGSPGGNYVWLNDGSGTFSQGSQVLVTSTRRVALGDLDGDGDLDAFIGVTGQSEVALNDGSGTFTSTSQFLGNGDVRGLALFDQDGDGDLDALLGKYFDRDELWLNDGAGVFASRLSQNIGTGTTADLAVGDFDFDGDLDYFAPGAEQNDDQVWLNSLSGVFGSVTLLQGAAVDVDTATTGGSAAGDLNGDGNLDLVLMRVPGVQVLLGQGDGTFGTAMAVADSHVTAGEIELLDANGDGHLDMIQAAAGSITGLFLGDGTGSLTLSPGAFGVLQADRLAVGDVDADGHLDVILGFLAADDAIYLGDGAGAFVDSTYTIAGLTTQALELGDFDGDSDLDVFIGTPAANRVALNDGAGLFTLTGQNFGAADTLVLAIADVDHDGDLDVLAGNNGAPATVFVADGTGDFPLLTTFGNGVITAISVGDFNVDGHVDAALGDFAGVNSALHLGAGTGLFPTLAQGLGTSTVLTGLAADFDNDGDLDLFQGNGAAADTTWSID